MSAGERRVTGSLRLGKTFKITKSNPNPPHMPTDRVLQCHISMVLEHFSRQAACTGWSTALSLPCHLTMQHQHSPSVHLQVQYSTRNQRSQTPLAASFYSVPFRSHIKKVPLQPFPNLNILRKQTQVNQSHVFLNT